MCSIKIIRSPWKKIREYSLIFFHGLLKLCIKCTCIINTPTQLYIVMIRYFFLNIKTKTDVHIKLNYPCIHFQRRLHLQLMVVLPPTCVSCAQSIFWTISLCQYYFEASASNSYEVATGENPDHNQFFVQAYNYFSLKEQNHEPQYAAECVTAQGILPPIIQQSVNTDLDL